jgi:hypothetical protein
MAYLHFFESILGVIYGIVLTFHLSQLVLLHQRPFFMEEEIRYFVFSDYLNNADDEQGETIHPMQAEVAQG